MLCRNPRNEAAMRRIVIAVGVTTLLAWTAHSAGYRWNNTDSLPRGLWKVTRTDHVQVGEIAYFCPPATREFTLALDRGYIAAGPCPSGTAALFKRLVAAPGDTVEVSDHGLSVNGGPLIPNSAPLCADGAGLAMPILDKRAYTVGRGSGWFLSDYSPYSYDSRYFGELPLRLAKARAEPIWTYEP